MHQTSEVIQKINFVADKNEKIEDNAVNHTAVNITSSMIVIFMCIVNSASSGKNAEWFTFQTLAIITSFIPISFLTEMVKRNYDKKNYNEALTSMLLLIFFAATLFGSCFR